MLAFLLQLTFLAMVIASVTMTLVRSSALSGARDVVVDKVPWLGRLINCPYCTIHWLSLATVLLSPSLPIAIFSSLWVINVLATSFALVTLSTLFTGLIGFALRLY